MAVKKIISGGQTGADQGGLIAGRQLKLETGGTAPKGFRTANGDDPRLALLGLTEHTSREYPPRTKCNVRDSDGTLVIGRHTSPGSKLTIRLCADLRKPCFLVPWMSGQETPAVDAFRAWLQEQDIQVLNVAGNGEDGNKGIGRVTIAFLVEALTVQATS